MYWGHCLTRPEHLEGAPGRLPGLPLAFDGGGVTVGHPRELGAVGQQLPCRLCVLHQPTLTAENVGPAGAWLRLFLLRLAGSAGVTGVSIRSTGSAAAWQPMVNKFGASWETYSQPPQPCDLYVTTDDGQSATLVGIVTAGAAGVVDSDVQLSTTPTTWDPSVLPTAYNPDVEPGSTAASVASVAFGAAAQSSECCDSAGCYDINFSGALYTCAQQKAFGQVRPALPDSPRQTAGRDSGRPRRVQRLLRTHVRTVQVLVKLTWRSDRPPRPSTWNTLSCLGCRTLCPSTLDVVFPLSRSCISCSWCLRRGPSRTTH